MADFRIVVSDPKTGKAYQVSVPKEKCRALIGLKIGDTFPGEVIGLPGYKLEIRGGTDEDGFPMRPDVHGASRKRVLISSGPGLRPKRKGERRRKTVRGNVISMDIAQINVKVVGYGEKSLEELLGKKEEKKEEEGKE